MPMLDPGVGKTKKAYIWGYARSEFDGLCVVVYDFCIGRGAKYPVAFLDGWNGTLVCDDYAGYEPVFKLGGSVEAGYVQRFYNPTRRHSTLGYVSPAQFEATGKA